MHGATLQTKSNCAQKIVQHNICNNKEFIIQTVTCMSTVSATVIQDTLQMMSSFSVAMINEALCALLQHDNLLQLISGVNFVLW